MVNYVKTKIEIGLPKPLRFLHVTDNHLSLADERDNERKRELAAARRKAEKQKAAKKKVRFHSGFLNGRVIYQIPPFRARGGHAPKSGAA